MAKSITMKDIATELGVSTVSVSKALTDKDGVSDEVRQRIKEKALEMGYRYRSAAKVINDSDSGNIGIIVSNRFFEENSFYNNLYRNIVLKLNDTEFLGILEIVSEDQEQICAMPNMINTGKIDGIIIMGQMDDNYIKAIEKTNVPFVLLDFYSDVSVANSITTDNVYGSYHLTNYLIRMGHTKIGFVGSINSTSSIMDRYLGYLKGLLHSGIPVRDDWRIEDRGEDGKFIPLELPEELPTAFVCNCDVIAYNLVQFLKAKNIRVPEDVSIVGFDDYLFSQICEPQLTTYKVNFVNMAASAVEAITREIKSKAISGSRSVVGGEVVIRDSVIRINN